jgi:hypothetical protein
VAGEEIESVEHEEVGREGEGDVEVKGKGEEKAALSGDRRGRSDRSRQRKSGGEGERLLRPHHFKHITVFPAVLQTLISTSPCARPWYIHCQEVFPSRTRCLLKIRLSVLSRAVARTAIPSW